MVYMISSPAPTCTCMYFRMDPQIDDFCLFYTTFQVENLLISSKGYIKLCDFGSATTQAHYPDETWSAMKRSLVEDEVFDFTKFVSNMKYLL